MEYFHDALNPSIPPVTWDPSLKGIVYGFKAIAAKYTYTTSTRFMFASNADFTYFTNSKLRIAHEHLQARLKTGLIREVATNQTSIELAKAAEAHSRAYFLETAVNATQGIRQFVSGALSIVIEQLIELFVVDTCQRSIADLIRVLEVNVYFRK